MNYPYVHLILGHVSIITLPVTVLFLFFATYKKNNQMRFFSLWILFFSGLIVLPTFLTGEPAFYAIEGFASIRDTIVHTHEEFAEKTLTIILINAGLALIALFYHKNEKWNLRLSWGVLSVAIISSMALLWTAKLGGQIRHSETRISIFESLN